MTVAVHRHLCPTVFLVSVLMKRKVDIDVDFLNSLDACVTCGVTITPILHFLGT